MDKRLSRSYLLFGGDYNPDQWDEKTIYQDMEYFKEAGINTVTLPVFTWAKLQPADDVYDFGWLDRIIDILDENNMSYFLATPTSAQPSWMSKKYPEVLPVDIAGRKRTHGMRVFFCVNSVKYRQEAAAIAFKMAERYKNRKGLIGWHVANEYGTYCYCENCQNKFRNWLKLKYKTIAVLNDKWHTCFWGKTLYSFDEIMLPTELNDDYRFNPVVQLEYMRFMTDSTIECYENEAKILKAITPDLPVFTNISGYIKKLDQSKMAAHMDCAGWDNYPWITDERSFPAFKHDIMRGLKHGESYYVMEQSPNQQNWQPYNKLKRPGEIRRLAYQGIAHGSDSSLYFQMRQSIAGQEKFHGAVISHNGRNDTRVFKEMKKIGCELKNLGDRVITAKTPAKVGILFDWENWWALELCSGPTKDINYLEEVHYYYKHFYYHNIAADVVMLDDDLSKYKVLVAPMLYMMKGNIAERLEAFVKEGGTLVGSYMTGYADETDRCRFGAYPGPLRDVFGIWVEETDALKPEEFNEICDVDVPAKTYKTEFLCDLIHAETSKILAVYQKDFYKGMPAVTCNEYGKGKAYYICTRPDQEYLNKLYSRIEKECSIKSVLPYEGELEITMRQGEQGETWFVLNHGTEDGMVDLGSGTFINMLDGSSHAGKSVILANDVWVLKKVRQEG